MSLGTNIDKGVSAQKNRTGIGNSDSGPMENIPMVTSSWRDDIALSKIYTLYLEGWI